MKRKLIRSLLLTAVLCVSAGAQAQKLPPEASKADPWETFNRGVFIFNGVLDHFVFKPVAEVYDRFVPSPVRTGVGNVLGNFGDMWSTVNLVLQAKPQRAIEMGMRVSINSVIGLVGLLDIASEAGLERHQKDMGLTLATWGVPNGPYLVLPFFGSSTLRDAVAFPADYAWTQAWRPHGQGDRYRLTALRLTETRAGLLPFTRMLDTVALDKYVFVRDAYLAHRRSQIYDGAPPPEEENESAEALSAEALSTEQE